MFKSKKGVLRLEDGINNIKTIANQFSTDFFNQKIIDSWAVLKEHKAKEDLKIMPIDTISTLEKRMRINM